MKRGYIILAIILLVLFLDQAVKFWVKMSMCHNEMFPFLGMDWLKIHFIENEGMAFGLTFGGSYGKLALSLFRIIAVGFIGYSLFKMVNTKVAFGFSISIALIFTGALGNILDSMFYGLMFSKSGFCYHSECHGCEAMFLPPDGGYAGFLHGSVVDMLHVDIILHYPNWFPYHPGEAFSLFPPIFNLADAAISIGVVLIAIFHRRFFDSLKEAEAVEKQKPAETPEAGA